MKKPIVLIIIAVMLFLPFKVTAESKYILSFERSNALMNVYNGNLKKLERSENDALRQYNSYKLEAENLDTEGFTMKVGGNDYYIHYNLETILMMKKAKELYPGQMEYVYEYARDNRTITTNSLRIVLRGVFFGVFNASEDMKLKQNQLNLAVNINNQDKIKLKQGIITGLDMQESNYNLLKAQTQYNAARRNYDNAVRSFNQFIGCPADMQYSDIIFDDKLQHPVWKSVDYYIEQAFSKRSDISSIQKQISLKEQEKKLDEESHVYSSTIVIECEGLTNDIDQLKIDLESMKISIADEIRSSYVDVIKAGKSVDSISNTLKLQQSSYKKMNERYKAGMISKNMMDQAEIGLMQVEMGYKATLFDYNTKIMRFNNATGIGPEY